MLALKTGHQLNWGDLQYIENPMIAKLTLKSNHGARIGGEPIHNAIEHNLPDHTTRAFDAYGEINRKLDQGQVFLVNSSTNNPLFTELKITKENTAKWAIQHSQTAFLENAVDAFMRHITVPQVHGVLRQEAKEQKAEAEETKIEREKHVILLNLEGQNDRPLPLKHNITLFVENTTQGLTAARQLREVIYNPISKVFFTEQGDQLKVYAIPDSRLDILKDLKANKNLADSESKGLISALEETGQETRDDGAILHHVKYPVPNNYSEIELVDEDGHPVPDAPYRILDVNGKVISRGHLDENGYAIVGNIETNNIEIFFPNVDQGAVYEKEQGEQA
jgi:hypothetical protein